MVETNGVTAGPRQFQLRLGLEAPNHFRVNYVTDLTCASVTRCTGRGGYLEGNLSASGNRYELELRDGRWRVTGDSMEWIS